MRKNGNWGIKRAVVLTEIEKPNTANSIVRVRYIETNDDQTFVDIRNWYNKQGEDDFPNQGKGIWLPADTGVLKEVMYTLDELADEIDEGIEIKAKG